MKLKLIVLILLLALLLTGCYSFASGDALYALPQQSEEYRALQKAVESAMGSGSYSAPVSGDNLQPIQRVDLDGDGQKETVVFCKKDGDRPLKMLIFRREQERFILSCTLEGDGSAFDSVQYAQVDGLPGMEILVSRRLGEQVQQFLSVYTFHDGTAKELMSSGCYAYTVLDLDGDQRSDIFILRANADGPRAFAELYRFGEEGLQKDAESSLSTGVDSVKRILTGQVDKGVPAVFVASAYDENNLITDVFALNQNVFTNITQNDESGQSAQTVRNYYVYSTDIDGDGVIELPETLALPALEGDSSSEGQYRILWYNLSPDGTRTEKKTTYHNFAEGWFLFLPESWCQNLCVTKRRSEEGYAGTELALLGEDQRLTPLVTVYSFTGSQAQKQSGADGRFLLAQRGEVFVSALLGEAAGLDQEELLNWFRFISPDLLPNDK
ncbi:MAG: hypothetical protein J5789_08520 [Oscillospiraceae bacterium]|nr:hypothetical protein [Oscillospiraceae bacterium]